jgi:hypothetical protein
MSTSFEFGYHSGHFGAAMMCRHTCSHVASIKISLCANRSARTGSKACGQWISGERLAKSSFMVIATFLSSRGFWTGLAWLGAGAKHREPGYGRA